MKVRTKSSAATTIASRLRTVLVLPAPPVSLPSNRPQRANEHDD